MLAANVPNRGTFWSSFAAQETVRACQRRSRCGVFRGCPVLSSHFSSGLAPQVGHGIANICFAETLMLRRTRNLRFTSSAGGLGLEFCGIVVCFWRWECGFSVGCSPILPGQIVPKREQVLEEYVSWSLCRSILVPDPLDWRVTYGTGKKTKPS
jgi:hypothetical protein